MKFPWAITLAREDAATLSSLRLQSGIDVAEAGNAIWLRGQAGDEALQAKLASLPATSRFEWQASSQLRQLHERIPSARLPELSWQSLAAWLQGRLPVAALPAHEPVRMALRLVRSSDEHEPQLLLTTLEAFKRFVATAARVRLQRLHFAADADRNVLVRGTPLPPLPGQRFVLWGGVAVPAGFAWVPAVSVQVLAQKFGVPSDALILWNADGTITRLHSEQFVPVSPGALRATEQGLAESP